MKSDTFYKCGDCDSIVLEMSHGKKKYAVSSKLLLVPKTGKEDASTVEKHEPVVSYMDNTLSVTVGSTPHPMTEGHYIQWIYVQTKTDGIIRKLLPEDAPKAVFTAQKDSVADVYAYCNVHGLWKADPEEFVSHQAVCSAEFSEGCIDA